MDVPLAKPITGSLALQIQEIGYGFCASAVSCKKCLAMLGVNIIPSCVAHVLAMMVRTYHGLKSGVTLALSETPWPEELKGREEPETWDVANFVTVLHEIAPNLNWSEVVMELDHPGFMVKDKPGLRLLTVALLKGLRDKIFPIALLYKLWNNKDGQLSWLKQIILNPDVFCLEDVQHRNVSTEMLSIAPDEADRFVAQWKCLDLIEILLQLSDAPGLYGQANECFLQAKMACPDLLILGLLQISMPINQIRQELLLACMPIFLGNHPNSITVLQAAWNSPIHTLQLRQLMLSGMAEWYLRGPDDPLKLGRLLDIAHDLKALPYLLNVQHVQQFAFGLDLACLASRREYLKLEKWITYKIQELREPFVQACIIFLKGRFPNIVDGLAPGEAPKPAHLPPETLATLLACLQTVVSSVSPTSAQEIMQVLQNCRILLAQKAAEVGARGPVGPPRQQQPPGPSQQQPILRQSLPPGGAGGPITGGVVGRSSLPVGASQFPSCGFGNAGFPGAPMGNGKSMDSFAPSLGAAGVGGARPGRTLDSIFDGQSGVVRMPNFGTIGAGDGGGFRPRFRPIAPTIFSQGVPATSPATASGGLGGSVMNFDQNFMHQQRPSEPMLMPIGGLRPHHTQQQQQSKSHASQPTNATAACAVHACPYCSLTFPTKRHLGQHKRYNHPKEMSQQGSSGHIGVPHAALNAPIDYSEICDFVFEHDDLAISDKKLAAAQQPPTSILSAASDLSDLFSDDCQPAEQSSSSVGNPAMSAQFVGQSATVASAQSAGHMKNAAGPSRRSSRRSRAQQMTTHCCDVHQKWFKSDTDLKRHLNSKRYHPDTAALTEKCPYCPHLFSPQQKRNMEDHIATVHTGNFPFRCALCRYGCSERRHLIHHLRLKHDSVLPPSRRKPRAGIKHRCPVCLLGFWNQADRSSHVREQHPKLPKSAAQKAREHYWSYRSWLSRVHSTAQRQAERALRKTVEARVEQLQKKREQITAQNSKLPADVLARQREVLELANAYRSLGLLRFARKPSTVVAAAKPQLVLPPTSLPSNQRSLFMLSRPNRRIRAAVRASSTGVGAAAAAAPFRPRHCRMDPKAKLLDRSLDVAQRSLLTGMLEEVVKKLQERQQQRAPAQSAVPRMGMAWRRNTAPACSVQETASPETADGDPTARRHATGWINPAVNSAKKRRQNEQQAAAAAALPDATTTPREQLVDWPADVGVASSSADVVASACSSPLS